MIKEFRDFILKGNMFELAVAFIMGAAFNEVVKAFTGVLLGLIGLAGKLPDFSVYKPKDVPVGVFLNSIISLLIVGFALFLCVKAYNMAKKRFEVPVEAKGSEDVSIDTKLLTEIRDLLKQKA
jgi:large conductance mechanosensitive channel